MSRRAGAPDRTGSGSCGAGEPIAERPHMPDYGVDVPGWTPLPWSWAAQRLTRCRTFWVATASAAGRPHALPVWGVWDDTEHRFAFSSGPRSRRAADLAANPAVAVAVDDTVEVVSVEGRAAPVDDGPRHDGWVARYLAKYAAATPGLDAAFLRANLLVEVVPERAYGVIEREPEFATRATRWRF